MAAAAPHPSRSIPPHPSPGASLLAGLVEKVVVLLAGPLRVRMEQKEGDGPLALPGAGLECSSPDPPILARGCQGQASATLDSSVDNASRIPPKSVCVCGGGEREEGSPPCPSCALSLGAELRARTLHGGCRRRLLRFQAQSPAPHCHLVPGLLAGDGTWQVGWL